MFQTPLCRDPSAVGAPVGDSRAIRQIAKTKEDKAHEMTVLEPRPQLGCKTASKDSSTSGAEDSRVHRTRSVRADFVHAKRPSTDTIPRVRETKEEVDRMLVGLSVASLENRRTTESEQACVESKVAKEMGRQVQGRRRRQSFKASDGAKNHQKPSKATYLKGRGSDA